MRILGGMLVAWTLLAQSEDSGIPSESLLLARIRAHMAEQLKRQPNYTCLETIERTRRDRGGRPQMVDTLRLEVALVDGKELFAWPGAKQFEEKDIREIVSTGTFGNGQFASFAQVVFRGNTPNFASRGEEALNNVPALRFDFRVPLIQSGYKINVGSSEATVGFHGSFWADPATMDVRRLEIFADDLYQLPEIQNAYDRMDYERVMIGGEKFLLPVDGVLEMKTGTSDSRNVMRFSNCRQYSGESVLRFTEEVTESALIVQEVREVQLPTDAELRLTLAADVKLTNAAVGDEVTATLASDIRFKRQVLALKGAVAKGRISRFERYPDHIALGIRFTDLEGPDWHAKIEASLDPTVGTILRPVPPRTPLYRPAPGEGILRLVSSQKTLSRGMLMFWRIN